MWPDRVSNPGPLTYESGALPIALRGPACSGPLTPTVTTVIRLWESRYLSYVSANNKGISQPAHPHESDLSLCCNFFFFFFFSGRFQHNNDYIPGKALRSHKCTYVPYGGKEIPSSNYEILVSDDQSILKWIPESGGKNP